MRIAKIIVTYLSIGFLGLITLSLLLFHIFKRDLNNMVLATLQPYIKAEVKVGSLQTTFLETFPKGSIELVNVRIGETDSTSSKNAYEIGRVYLLFDYKDFITGNIRIRQVIIRDALIHMAFDKNGKSNFEFWNKEAKSVSDSTQVALDLDQVVIYNSKYSFYNQKDDFALQAQIKKGQFSLHSLAGKTQLEILADFDIKDLRNGQMHWIQNKKLSSSLGFVVADLDKYTIQNGDLMIEGMKFSIDGTIDKSSKDIYTDIRIKSTYSRLEELLSLSPDLLQGSLDDYEIQGATYFNTEIKGLWSADKTAQITVGFGLREGYIKQISSDIALRDLHLDGQYTNGTEQNGNSSIVALRDIKATHNTGKVEGDFYLKNFNDPFCRFDLDANVKLDWVGDMFKLDDMEEMRGDVEGQFSFEGLLSDLEKVENLHKVTVQGDWKLRNLFFKHREWQFPIAQMNGELTFEKPILWLRNFQFSHGNSAMEIEGYFKNPLTFMTADKLYFYGDLTCDSLDLNFLAEIEEQNTDVDTAAFLEEKSQNNLDFLFANLNTHIGRLTYDNFVLQDVKGGAKFFQNQLFLNELSFETLGGKVGLSGIAKINEYTGYTIDAELEIDSLAIERLFLAFDNFDQSELVAEQLKGQLSTQSSISFQMNDSFLIDFSTFSLHAPIEIVHGELIDYIPMIELAGFVKLKQFQHLYFDTLKSQVFIQNEQIHIPETQVSSNSFFMTVSGQHNFDNQINYQMAIRLKKLFMERNGVNEKDFGYYENEPKGGIKIYLSMTGTADDPKIAYHMGSVSKKLGQGLKQEKEAMKEARAKEQAYKSFKRDSLVKLHRAKQKIRRKKSIKEAWDDLVGK